METYGSMKKFNTDDFKDKKFYNNYNTEFFIVEYINAQNIFIKFNDEYGYSCKVEMVNINNGSVKNPYDKTVFGIGFLGKYYGKINMHKEKSYGIWRNILYRCYIQTNRRYNTYKDCSICDDWFNYSNFKDWYDNNFYQVENEYMELDKDILIKGNKIYSPSTCCFVPSKLNALLYRRQNKRGKYPLGVTKHGRRKRFTATIGIDNEHIVVEGHDTIEEAFLCYKEHKENYIKNKTRPYRDKIPQNIYEALMNYQVDIND